MATMRNEIPEGWAVGQFRDLTKSIKSGLSRKISSQDIGIPVLISGNIQNNQLDVSSLRYWYVNDPQGAKTENYLLQNNDILLCFINSLSQIGKVCVYKDIGRPAIYTTNLFRVVAASNVDPQFVYQLMTHENFQTKVQLITKPAVNQASFTKSDLEEINVNIPPLTEQQKIATILSSVDDVIEKTRAQIDKLKDLKTGMMQELLTKGIGHTEFKDSPVGRIPTAWNIVAQGDVATFFNGRAYKLTEWEDTGTPVIRLQNLTGSGRNFYYSTLQLPERQYCEKGDLLYMWSATFGPHIWQGPKAIYHYHIWKVEADETKIKKAFLFYLLDFKTKQWKEQSSNGMGILHVTKGAMEEMELALPPISEQQRIATALQATDLKLELSQQQLEYRLKIKKALMQDLLTGKVRVNLTDKESAVV
jgi:type I restriction enzyme S subunit